MSAIASKGLVNAGAQVDKLEADLRANQKLPVIGAIGSRNALKKVVARALGNCKDKWELPKVLAELVIPDELKKLPNGESWVLWDSGIIEHLTISEFVLNENF